MKGCGERVKGSISLFFDLALECTFCGCTMTCDLPTVEDCVGDVVSVLSSACMIRPYDRDGAITLRGKQKEEGYKYCRTVLR
jgi:hypothetical protein